jgi:hypothetical protein
MGQSISTFIHPGFTLAAGATANVDVRLTDIVDMRIMLQQVWATTSSTTGVAVNLYPGFSPIASADPREIPGFPIPVCITNPASAANYHNNNYIFGNNFAAVTTTGGGTAIIQPTPSSSNQSTNTVFYLNTILIIWPQILGLQIVNLDQTNAVTIKLLADI